MKAKLLCCVMLGAVVTVGQAGGAAAQTGWLRPGVRVWYLGGVDGGGVISSNAEQAYLIDTVNGTNAQVVHHSALTNWTSPLPVQNGAYSTLDQGPCWIHPEKLQVIEPGDYWRDPEQVITVVQRPTYTYATFLSSVLPAKVHFLPIKALFDLSPTRQLVKLSYMIDQFSVGNAYFDAETGLLLYHNELWGVGKMFFVLAEINYDFALETAFPEDDGPHTGFWSMASEQSLGNPFLVGGGSVIIQTLFETRYGSALGMRVLSSRTPAAFPDTGMADENYYFDGEVPILRRIDAALAGNVLPEQWNAFGQYLWWWLPRTATGAQVVTADGSHATAAVQGINVFDVPMTKTSDQPLTYTATQSPPRFHFSMLRFDQKGYMTEFSARDPASGLNVQPGDFYFQNGTTVDGLDYYLTEMESPLTVICGQPVTSGAKPTASDCLYILRTAVGTETCTPECICDVNAAGGVTASDALLCLRKAVGQDVTLDCGAACPVTGMSSAAMSGG